MQRYADSGEWGFSPGIKAGGAVTANIYGFAKS